MLRVLHLGLGPLGRMIAEQLHRSGVGVVAGAIDPAPALRGKRLSDAMAEYGPANPTIAGSIDEIGANAAFDVAIVTTSSDLPRAPPPSGNCSIGAWRS
jgi:Trk K+ transport system NAD-binding subunit